MSENVEYQPWMDSPWVSTMEDYEDTGLEDVIDTSKIAWFDVKMDLSDTEQEKKEKVEAMQEQIRMGILQPNGFPVGMAAPRGAYVQGAAIPVQNRGFNFPGAIGIPLPKKFDSTPVTPHLQAVSKQPIRTLQSLPVTQKGQDRSVFQRGEENLRRIQELTRDRRK